jgi:hypothetical protein
MSVDIIDYNCYLSYVAQLRLLYREKSYVHAANSISICEINFIERQPLKINL